MTVVNEEVLIARAYLSRVSEPASIEVWRFVAEHGPIAVLHAIAHGEAPPEVRSQTEARVRTADPLADLEAAQRLLGVRLVVPESEDWPYRAMSRLRALLLSA